MIFKKKSKTAYRPMHSKNGKWYLPPHLEKKTSGFVKII